jgi:hypothetical protein
LRYLLHFFQAPRLEKSIKATNQLLDFQFEKIFIS